MSRAPTAALLALLIVAAPGALMGQTTGWEVSAGIPFDAQFGEYPQAPTPPPARFPTGLRVAALSPFHVGAGLAVYRTGFDRPVFPYADRTLAVQLLEVQAVFEAEGFRFGFGLGRGRARFSPVSATNGTITQEYLASPAMTWFLVTAYRLDARWSAELGLHLLRVRVNLTTDGAPAQGDLEARLLTGGLGWRF
jgi:hypothetical protein